MKIYTKGILLIALILLGGLQNAFAQSCSLPAPSAWVNEVTPTTIEIEWSPIVGATAYEIITEEVISGTIISNVTQTGTIYVATGLQPNTDYVFTIRPICPNGDYGGTETLTVRSGVIVVDVVVQLECPGGGGTVATQPGLVPYPFNQSVVMVFTGEISALPGREFKIVVDDQSQLPNGKNQNTVGTTLLFQGNMQFTKVAPDTVKVVYTDPVHGNTIHLADVNPSTGTNSRVNIKWRTKVDVSVARCNTNPTWQGNDDPGGLGGGGLRFGLVMAPNPASDFVNISSEIDTPLQITDLYGTPWYDGEVLIGEDLYLDISFWPAGTYIVSYFDGYEMQAEQLIKL